MYCSDIFRRSAGKFSSIPTVIISCIWILGLLTGCYFALQLSDTAATMMYNAATAPVSFLRLYFALFLPFVLTAFFARLSLPLFSIIVVFLKALSFGFCACGIITVFASAGWLIRVLLLFSDSAVIVMLIWFWIRSLSGNNNRIISDLLLCAAYLLTITCVDYFAVSPFFIMLLNI